MFLLGLDGLDGNLAKLLKLKHLTQEHNGSLQVPLDPIYGLPSSPTVWASFLTGKVTFQHWVDPTPSVAKQFIAISKFVKWKVFKGKMRLPSRFTPRRIAKQLGHACNVKKWPKLTESTFVDHPNVSEINSVYYSYRGDAFLHLTTLSLGDMRCALKHKYERDKTIILKASGQPRGKAIFAYIHFPDAFQHVWWTHPHQVYQHYVNLNMFVGQLQEAVEDEVFIIVSDHGFNVETGLHSLKGFYSSNVPLNPEPVSITDFHSLVLEHVN